MTATKPALPSAVSQPQKLAFAIPTAAGKARDEIRDIQRMLHLAHHRNKNQHRGARWWGSFGVLRRQIGRLVVELEDPLPVASVPHGNKALKKMAKREEEGRKEKALRVEKRVLFLREVIIAKCWLAFSAVVVDTQFSALGLMLIGTLARLDSLIAPMVPESKVSFTVPNPDFGDKVHDHVFAHEDLGEKISREKALEGDGGVADLELPTENKKKRRPSPENMGGVTNVDLVTPRSTQTKPEKKRRKKGDVFDEIFSALISQQY